MKGNWGKWTSRDGFKRKKAWIGHEVERLWEALQDMLRGNKLKCWGKH